MSRTFDGVVQETLPPLRSWNFVLNLLLGVAGLWFTARSCLHVMRIQIGFVSASQLLILKTPDICLSALFGPAPQSRDIWALPGFLFHLTAWKSSLGSTVIQSKGSHIYFSSLSSHCPQLSDAQHLKLLFHMYFFQLFKLSKPGRQIRALFF